MRVLHILLLLLKHAGISSLLFLSFIISLFLLKDCESGHPLILATDIILPLKCQLTSVEISGAEVMTLSFLIIFRFIGCISCLHNQQQNKASVNLGMVRQSGTDSTQPSSLTLWFWGVQMPAEARRRHSVPSN